MNVIRFLVLDLLSIVYTLNKYGQDLIKNQELLKQNGEFWYYTILE